jgi:hypothetical protein
MTSPSCEYIPLYFFCEIYTRADHHLYSSCWRITRRMRSFLAPWLAQVMLWLQATSNEGFRFRSLSCCICNVPGWDSMVLQKTCALAAEHQFCLDHVYLVSAVAFVELYVSCVGFYLCPKRGEVMPKLRVPLLINLDWLICLSEY